MARFIATAEKARILLGIIGGLGGLLAVKLSGPTAPLVLPGAYMVIVAALVVVAMDYADSIDTLNTVKGIRAIGRELSVAAEASSKV